MYANRKHVRKNPVKVRFNQDEITALTAMAERLGKQPAVVAYELLLEAIEEWESQHKQTPIAA